MDEVRPIATFDDWKAAFDNGGRFFNVLTKAADGVIQAGEIARAAGTVAADTSAFLFFELTRWALPTKDKLRAVDMLDATMRQQYERLKPVMCKASRVPTAAVVGSGIIASGYPRACKVSEGRHVTIPLREGGAMRLRKVPVSDKLDLYELHDTPEGPGVPAIISTPRGVKLTRGAHIVVAGVACAFPTEGEAGGIAPVYVEAMLFSRVPPRAEPLPDDEAAPAEEAADEPGEAPFTERAL